MTKAAPPVTVITSTYHWPDALQEAMATVLSQDFGDFEYLVIGDGCLDETEDVVRSFKDPRVRWFNLEQNTGNQSGVNRVAMEMARSRYIAYLNHDDLWFPDHLGSLLEVLRGEDLDIVSSIALSIAPPGHNYRALIGAPRRDRDGNFILNPITSNVMHTRSVAAEAGNWIDWRDSKEVPTQDFFRRVREVRGAFAVLNGVTSLKFHSAQRRDCYRHKTATEQALWRQKITDDSQLRYREVMTALAFNRMQIRQERFPRPDMPADAPEGWLIEQWRRIRGLEPMLDVEGPQDIAELPVIQDMSVCVREDGTALVVDDSGGTRAQGGDAKS